MPLGHVWIVTLDWIGSDWVINAAQYGVCAGPRDPVDWGPDS